MPPKSPNSNQSGVTTASGLLLTCDPPMKQFIMHLNDKKSADKKFIIEDVDATHLLIKGEVRDEISRKVDEWMDEVRSGTLIFVYDLYLPVLNHHFICYYFHRMYILISNESEKTWTHHRRRFITMIQMLLLIILHYWLRGNER
jgi:TFIIH basal transcription factor complex TTD-A subunit